MKPGSPILQRLLGAASIAAIAIAAATLQGCEPYPAYTAAPVSKFDRVWDAAYGAAVDSGVRIQSADRATGFIRGTKDAVNVTIHVRAQADGSVIAEIKATGPSPQDKAVSQQLSHAYERRMGRQ